MGTDINLYKINNVDGLIDYLIKESYTEYSQIQNSIHNDEIINFRDFKFTLFIFKQKTISKIKWDWILNSFDVSLEQYLSKPKAILLVEKGNKNYAVSFGYAYHIVGKFSDKNWPLEFAERVEYNSVKSVGILAPNSLINRKIYNYFNYNYLDVDSGEALNSMSLNLNLEGKVSDYLSEYVMIGNSLKFKIKNQELDSICMLINFIDEIMDSNPKRNIPQLKKINHTEKINELNKKLIKSIREDILEDKEILSINIPEFTLDGFQHVFFNKDYDDFGFHLQGKRGYDENLSVNSVYDFIKEKNLINNDDLLDMKISANNNEEIHDYYFKNLIMYVDDENIYNEGKWYGYNQVFVDEIHETLDDIKVFYDENYDFLKKSLFESKRDELKTKTGYTKKCYFEYFFNKNIEFNNQNYVCYDRKTSNVKNHKIEDTDLFDEENHVMYAVKVGNSSGSLSYVVDQSLYSLKLLDDNNLKYLNKNDVSKVGLWLIFKRGNDKFTLNDDCLNWEEVNMLILKSKIADWKRQVRLSGREPIIRINYRYKDKNKNKD